VASVPPTDGRTLVLPRSPEVISMQTSSKEASIDRLSLAERIHRRAYELYVQRGNQISAITSAFLLVRSVFGLRAGFLAPEAFFAGFAFLALRSRFGIGPVDSGLLSPFDESIAFSLISVSP
jgi:hypothetical protein